MVEALLEKPIELFREGDIDGALADLDAKIGAHADVLNFTTCGLSLRT